MVFKIGHKTNQKLNTTELKELAYNSYCEHIARGYPKKAWCFRHQDVSLKWETMEKYIKEDPDTFDPIHKELAECDSYFRWFKVLETSATGENQKANPASLQMIMRNKFKWDANQANNMQTDDSTAAAHEKLMSQLNSAQGIPPGAAIPMKSDLVKSDLEGDPAHA
jgi:hypothetical protein